MKKLTLNEYVEDLGQEAAAAELGVHQTAISKALRKGRNIVITKLPTGEIKAEEFRPFPSQRNQHQRSTTG